MSASAGKVTGSVGRPTISSGNTNGSWGNPFQANLVWDAPLTNSLVSPDYTDATYTRSSAGWYRPTPSTSQTKASNVAGYENAIVIEGADTQRLIYNTELDHDWGTSPSTQAWNLSTNIDMPTQDGTLAPDGTATAWKITTTTAASSYLGQTVGADNSESAAVWLKAGNVSRAVVWFTNAAVSVVQANSGDITLTDEWQRIELQGAGAGGALAVFPKWTADGGTAGNYIYVWHPGIYDEKFPTSDIVTTTAAATRNSGVLSLPSGFCPEVNNDFAIAFDVRRNGATGGSQVVCKFQGETGNRQINISNTGVVTAFYGGVNQSSVSTPFDDGEWHRLLFTGDNTNYEVYVDGVQVLTRAIGTASGTHSGIDFNHNGSLFARCRNIAIYDKYFSATEAQEEYLNA